MKPYSVFLKIKVYKLLDLLNWSNENCKKLLHILEFSAGKCSVIGAIDGVTGVAGVAGVNSVCCW